LSGYIQHRDKDGRDKVYALTCRHVIDPHSALGNASQITPALLSVTCPATSDHNETIQTITSDIVIDAVPSERATLEQTLENAKEYNIAFGDVYATSGTGRLLPHFQGRSDWAIISITNPDIMAENKVCSLYGLLTGLMFLILAKKNSMSGHLVRLCRLTTELLLRSMPIFYTQLRNTSTQARILNLFETMT